MVRLTSLTPHDVIPKLKRVTLSPTCPLPISLKDDILSLYLRQALLESKYFFKNSILNTFYRGLNLTFNLSNLHVESNPLNSSLLEPLQSLCLATRDTLVYLQEDSIKKVRKEKY